MDESESTFDNNLFSNHFLKERIDELDEWQEASLEEKYEAFIELYEKNQRLFSNSPNESRTWSNFTSIVFKEILNHFDPQSEPSKYVSGTEYNPDYTLFNDFNQFLDAQENDEEFETCYAIVENKRWDRTLDKSTQDHRNPAFQTYNYVDRLRVDWGILTNGKKWRLYAYEDCEADTFYQIDVVEQIIKEDDREKALHNFKYFYLFFSKEAFTPKEEGFADKVLKGSFNYAQSLEEDLEKRIYDALEETSRGFFEFNDLEKTEENVDLVHRSSLILLYRLLFVLNAESRELLPVNEKLYRNKLSVAHFRENLKEEEDDGVFGDHDWAWDRLTRLFKAIDSGKQYGDYKITAYNGGLFRYPENADEDEEIDEENIFLANHKLSGQKFKEILKLLALSENEEEEEVLVDYKDLNIRHLGSVYEGLLEHELAVAEEDLVLEDGEWSSAEDSSIDFSEAEDKVEEGQVYITNESGERKATGSYYTPEYIVEYIIENTVKPKVEDKIEEAEDEEEILEKVKELNICDPAMGSGHFLTEATSFIAHKIAEEAQLEGKVDEENEIVWLKRQVVQNSIYGVDINPLAVELGKLSLWIETMAEGKPLSFLDHHLKVGNSLIGSDFENIFSHPTEKQKRIDNDRFKFGTPEDLKEKFEEDYREIEDLPEGTKKEVHKKEKAYREFKESTLYNQLKQLANIHTRQYFEEEADSSDYENFLINIGASGTAIEMEEWFKSAQKDAEQRRFFHWQLEFPKVFFGEQKGFDTVVGNPPYVRQELIKEYKDYLKDNYNVFEGRADIYSYFVERGLDIMDEDGKFGYILSHKFTKVESGEKLRSYLDQNTEVEQFIHFRDLPVFGEEISAYPAIMVLRKNLTGEKFDFLKVSDLEFENLPDRVKNLGKKVSQDELGSNEWTFLSDEEKSIRNKMEKNGSPVKDVIGEPLVGVKTGLNDVYIVDKQDVDEIISNQRERKIFRPFVKGEELKRYKTPEPSKLLLFPYEKEDGEFVPIDLEDYPGVKKYLKDNKDALKSRYDIKNSDALWYELRACDYYEVFDKEKITYPDISKKAHFTIDDGTFIDMTGFVLDSSDRFYLSQLNSKLVEWYIAQECAKARGGYLRLKTQYIKDVPLVSGTENKNLLREKASNLIELKDTLSGLTLDIDDYLQNYRDGDTLGDIYKPAKGIGDSVLTDTKEKREKLRIEEGKVEERAGNLILKISARYKPENKAAFETDRNGYTYTEFIPAMKFEGLSVKEKAMVKEYVPVAIEEEREGFKRNATKSNSLIDRLKELKLPKVEDVSDELASFVEEKERAEELRNKIEDQEQEINEIVYDLYDLTEEEIETVEEAI